MLYIIRHGKTDWNEEHRLQGRTDIPLNEYGRKMAKDASENYKEINFDICFCSPLQRARETAEILLQGRNVPVIYDDRLKEMSFGEAEGKVVDFTDDSSPIYDFFKRPEKYIEPVAGAESFEELFARTSDFLTEIALPLVKEGKDVLISGHGAMNSSIVCQIWNLPIKDFWSAGIENCELKRLIPVEI